MTSFAIKAGYCYVDMYSYFIYYDNLAKKQKSKNLKTNKNKVYKKLAPVMTQRNEKVKRKVKIVLKS